MQPLQDDFGLPAILTLEQGAQMPLYAALAPDLRSGAYWSDFEEETYANPITRDKALAAKLMDFALSAVQLQTQFRSISSNYPLRELRVRFVRASELQSRPVSLSERLLDAAVRPQAEADGDWYRRYRSLLKEVILCCPCPLSSTLFFCVL